MGACRGLAVSTSVDSEVTGTVRSGTRTAMWAVTQVSMADQWLVFERSRAYTAAAPGACFR